MESGKKGLKGFGGVAVGLVVVVVLVVLVLLVVLLDVVSWSEKNKNAVNYNVLSLLLGCVGGVEGNGAGRPPLYFVKQNSR